MRILYIKNQFYYRLLLLLGFFYAFAPTAGAQNAFSVSGKVIGNNGEGLPGVTVLVKGTTVGSTSGTDGTYSIQAPGANNTLVFSFIGYVTREVPINGNATINVTLAEDVEALNEVVVIGYGERERKDVVGSISQVNARDLAKSPYQSPELAMQGRMSGVQVTSSSGNPNSRPIVRVRGVGTFGNTEPLYVVDGIPLNEYGEGTETGLVGDIRGSVNVLNTLNPNDIESISVLKDATAAAIYGNRAAHGVILITTKRGKAGRPKVEVSASKGVQNVNTYKMLSVPDFVTLHQEMFANNPSRAQELPNVFRPDNAEYLGNSPTVDWQDALLNKNASIEDYSARILGGNESTTYYFSGGYNRTESPLKGNNSERYTFNANVDSKVNKYIHTGVTYKLSYIDAKDNTNGDLVGAANYSPWQQIYDPTNPYGYAPSVSLKFKENLDEDGNNKYDQNKIGTEPPFIQDGPTVYLYGPETNGNIFANQALQDRDYFLFRNMGTAFFQVEPISGLRFKGTLGIDLTQNRRNEWQDRDLYLFSQTPGNPYGGLNGLSKGSYSERHSRNYSINKEFSVNYTKVFGQHSVDVLLNAADQRFKYEFATLSGSQQESRDPLFRGISNVPNYIGASSFFYRSAVQGYLGRISYNFASKYYLDLVTRRDGSSRFAPGYKWGTFPAVSAAWRISAEPFMQRFPFITDLKLRGGWGRLGNEKTRDFAFLSTISNSPDYAFGSGNGNPFGSTVSGVRLPDFPVLDLSWETAETTNFGFDGAFLNNKITFTAEYYNKITRDILQVSNLAASVGNENQPILNIATVRNSGIELQAGYNGQVGSFQYNVGANFTTVRNRVLETFKDQPFGGDGGRIEVGMPLYYIRGYQVGGIFQTQAEIDAWKAAHQDELNGNNFAPGDMYFQDVNSKPAAAGEQPAAGPDGLINPNDRTFIGKTIPGYFYGLNLGANFKNFDLSVFFQGIGDVQKYNTVRQSYEQMNSQGINQFATVLNRWTPENPSTTMPRAVFADPAQNNRFSNRFVENAGFMRLKNVQLGYSLPQSVKTALGFVDNFRIFLAGTNLFTVTNWQGLDPENDFIPPTQSIMVGVNATF